MIVLVRFAVAFLAVPIVGTATAAGHALGGPPAAGVAFVVSLLVIAVLALPRSSERP